MNKLADKFQQKADKFPLRLKEMREKMGFSIWDLSDETGVDRTILSKLEHGYTTIKGNRVFPKPKSEVISKVSAALRTTPSQLEYGAIELPALNEDIQLITSRVAKLPFSKRTKAIAEINALLDNID